MVYKSYRIRPRADTFNPGVSRPSAQHERHSGNARRQHGYDGHDGIGAAQGIPVAIGRIAGVPGGGTLRGKAEFHAGSFRGAVLRLVCDDPLPSGGADDLRRPVHDACDLLGEEPVPVVVEVNAVGVIQLPPVRGRRVQVDGVPTLVTDQRLLYGM